MALGLLASAGSGRAEQPLNPVHFAETEIASLARAPVDAARPMDVFRYVLAAAGDEITVYPSEGYYYFQFQNGPQRILGNIRFDLVDAAQGKLNFGYSSPRAFGSELVNHFSQLTAADGVSLVAVSRFEYRLGFEGRTIRVLIHDARQELAGPKPLAAGETYVGPVFDESGVRMHLLFDEVENAFLFVRNDGAPPAETYSADPRSDRVEIGDRTGYAFYLDTARKRRILVGVSYANVRSNSYYDGPFDQLPDRFVDPKTMQALLERAYPHLRGRIGPRGLYLDSTYMRAMVAPYRQYESRSQLDELAYCDAAAADNHALTRCLRTFADR
ncbi:MAG TPA: hypothetical protein VF718_12915 [Allosphingosinicella sp.]